MPTLYAVLGVLQFVGDDRNPRMGLLWLGFAVYFAAYFAWTSYRARQVPQRVEQLGAAAATVSEAAPVLAETAGAVDLPSRRVWATVLMTAVLGAGFGITAYVWG